jgi:hypothetical protein
MFDPSNAPTLEQANYYKTANQNTGLTKPAMDAIFEGVMVNQGSMHGHCSVKVPSLGP